MSLLCIKDEIFEVKRRAIFKKRRILTTQIAAINKTQISGDASKLGKKSKKETPYEKLEGRLSPLINRLCGESSSESESEYLTECILEVLGVCKKEKIDQNLQTEVYIEAEPLLLPLPITHNHNPQYVDNTHVDTDTHSDMHLDSHRIGSYTSSNSNYASHDQIPQIPQIPPYIGYPAHIIRDGTTRDTRGGIGSIFKILKALPDQEQSETRFQRERMGIAALDPLGIPLNNQSSHQGDFLSQYPYVHTPQKLPKHWPEEQIEHNEEYQHSRNVFSIIKLIEKEKFDTLIRDIMLVLHIYIYIYIFVSNY